MGGEKDNALPGVSPTVNGDGGDREKQIMNPADPEEKRGVGGVRCAACLTTFSAS